MPDLLTSLLIALIYAGIFWGIPYGLCYYFAFKAGQATLRKHSDFLGAALVAIGVFALLFQIIFYVLIPYAVYTLLHPFLASSDIGFIIGLIIFSVFAAFLGPFVIFIGPFVKLILPFIIFPAILVWRLRRTQRTVLPLTTNITATTPVVQVHKASRILGIALLCGAALVPLYINRYAIINTAVPAIAEALHNPSLCTIVNPDVGTGEFVLASCIARAVPAEKQATDYCDYFPDLAYSPTSGTSGGIGDKTACLVQRAIQSGDPAQCDTLKDNPYARARNDCYAHFSSSSQHAAYCAEQEQKPDFYNMFEAQCFTDQNINIKDAQGRTVLFYLPEQPTLYTHHPDVNVADKSGETPLIHYLQERGPDRGVIASLLERGAKTNVSDEQGDTPLILAIQNDDDETILQLLVQYGADVHYKSSKGDTACTVARATEINTVTSATMYMDGPCSL